MPDVPQYPTGPARPFEECDRGNRQSNIDRSFHDPATGRFGPACVLVYLAADSLRKTLPLVRLIASKPPDARVSDPHGLDPQVSSPKSIPPVVPRSPTAPLERLMVRRPAMDGSLPTLAANQDSLERSALKFRDSGFCRLVRGIGGFCQNTIGNPWEPPPHGNQCLATEAQDHFAFGPH